MRNESNAILGPMILKILTESRNETSLSDLLSRLHRESGLPSLDDASVKAAVWYLIAQGEVELTSRRALRMPDKDQPRLAFAR